MRTQSGEKLATFQTMRREIKGRVTIYDLDGSTVLKELLPNETLAGFTIENSVPKGKFFGFLAPQKLTIELTEALIVPKGFRVEPLIYTTELTNTTGLELPYFYIDTVEVDVVKKTTKIVAYDKLEAVKDITIDNFTIAEAGTMLDYARTIATETGMTLEIADERIEQLNLNITPENVNINGTESVFEILTAITEVTGTIGFIQSGDKLIIKRMAYDMPTYEITPDNYFNFTSQDAVRLTGVASATQLGDNFLSGSNDSYVQTIWDNPFLTLRDDIPEILDELMTWVGQVSVMPYTLEFRGNPCLTIGDCVSITSPDNKNYNVSFLNETLVYKGGLRSTVFWEKGEDEVPEGNPTNIGEAIKLTAAKVDKVNNEISIVAAKANGNEEAISALRMNTDSISASVTSLREATEGAMETVHSDIVTLTNKVEATMTSEAVDLKIQSAMADGVNTVTTSTGFTFNEAGLTVSKTGSEMTTRIDEDGMSVYRDNTEVLTADNQGVIAYNLHAKNYLIMGEYSRFEDYTNTSGEARTGCFWIGG